MHDTVTREGGRQTSCNDRGLVRQAGADIILSNHTDWDGSKVNLPRLATRASGSPNPYVVGTAAAQRYLKVAEECARARLTRVN
jgi:metallo-beta-lactamase class B